MDNTQALDRAALGILSSCHSMRLSMQGGGQLTGDARRHLLLARAYMDAVLRGDIPDAAKCYEAMYAELYRKGEAA
jgi:hypothetical protein